MDNEKYTNELAKIIVESTLGCVKWYLVISLSVGAMFGASIGLIIVTFFKG